MAINEIESIRLKKALLILLPYPELGAPLILLPLLVAADVGFLCVPSEDEYPELSTVLWLCSLRLGLRCDSGLLELLLFSGDTEGQQVGV